MAGLDQQLERMADPALQAEASWQLKHELEGGARLDPAQEARLLSLLPALETWEAILHVLQVLDRIAIPKPAAARAAAFVHAQLEHRRPFVRAWAFHALHHLAGQHPSYRADFELRRAAAEEGESASVKARLRNLKPWA